MKAIIKQIKGCSFIGKAESNHWIAIDTPKETCGSDAAIHPMEMVLLALGSCTGADVVYILEKKEFHSKVLRLILILNKLRVTQRFIKKYILNMFFMVNM